MKVFGIGLNKTGTTTLASCLKVLGYKHCPYDINVIRAWYRQDIRALMQRVEKYESFEDWPWPLVYRELEQFYPESKFILTTRKSPEIWFKSICQHADRYGPSVERKMIYHYFMPHRAKDKHIAFYEKHNNLVRAYFEDKPDKLLEVCWEDGDSWDKVCTFLQKEVPSTSFPHDNSSKLQSSSKANKVKAYLKQATFFFKNMY